MILEIRLYTVVAGRIAVCYERFARHLPRVFARHGIRNVGRWTATAGAGGPMFVYALAYADLAQREAQWAAFYGDPDWAEIRAATQGEAEAVERFDLFFLKLSPVWTPAPAAAAERLGGVHDLVFAEVALGRNAAANAFLSETYLPLLCRAGARVMTVADFLCGPSLPRLALMLAWPDAAARAAGWRQVLSDAGLDGALADQRRAFGRPLLGRTDTYLLDPTPFDLPLATLGNPPG